jgi:hypothetical protein
MLRPVGFPDVEGCAPDQQLKRQAHLFAHDSALNIVGIRSLPAAIGEFTAGVFLWSAASLNDTI